MFVKKFEAESLEQALSMVKTELGPNALILSTQNRKGKWFNKNLVEVTAAFESTQISETLPEPVVQSFSEDDLAQVFPHRKRRHVLEEEAPQGSVRKQGPSRYAEVSGVAARPKQENLETMWLRLGFSSESAEELGKRLKYDYPKKDLANPSFLEKAKLRLVTPYMTTLAPAILAQRSHWTVVGVAGSGKTSLCVKLALHSKADGNRVALVSCDQRKLLGRKELASYAKLIQVSYYNEGQARKKEDLSFADSPALPSHNLEGSEERWNEIERACSERSVVVVLDATSRLSELIRQIDLAKTRLNIAAVAFTRMDVTSQYGIIFDILKQTKLPLMGASLSLSFKTAFKFFESNELANFILRSRPLSE